MEIRPCRWNRRSRPVPESRHPVQLAPDLMDLLHDWHVAVGFRWNYSHSLQDPCWIAVLGQKPLRCRRTGTPSPSRWSAQPTQYRPANEMRK